MIALETSVSVEEVVIHLLGDSVRSRRCETVRVLHPERGEKFTQHNLESSLEIIRRQDAEIDWLREQLTRLSTLNTITHVIRHEDPDVLMTRQEKVVVSVPDLINISRSAEIPVSPEDTGQQSAVTVDDVQYTPAPGDTRGFEELIPGLEDRKAAFSGPERASDRTLRDSIGGVREEKEYTIHEAAAISGDTEEVILEYVIDGFLPATKDGNLYRIRGNDLRRYMLSK